MLNNNHYVVVRISPRKWAVASIMFKEPWEFRETSIYEVIAYFSDWPKATAHIRGLVSAKEKAL